MKKITLVLGILMSLMFIINNKKEYVLIPDEAIRVRVIANSDGVEDLKVKEKVKEDIKSELNKMLASSNSIEDTRKIINNNLEVINKTVDKSLEHLNYNETYSIKYGLNYFPEKEFLGVKYNSGYYESLVITLGNGDGSNFWCVLYPPLCDLENDNNKDIEYKIFIKEVLDKYL